MSRRVVITGLGIISPIGVDKQSFWTSLLSASHGFAPIHAVACDQLRFQNGAEVHDFDPLLHIPADKIQELDRASQFAVVAARQALSDSGIELSEDLRQRTAVITGTAASGIISIDHGANELYQQGKKRVHPLSVPRIMANAPTSQICMDQCLKGPAYTVVTACSSANNAIGQAYWMIRSGVVDIALSGGAEAPFSYIHLKAWEALRVIDPNICRPFSSDRRGMLLGEGAGMLLLESLESAKSRKAPILAEIIGYGASSDAAHLTFPDANGAARAIEYALSDAGLAYSRHKIGYVNAHGTGTQINDTMETSALRQVFGSYADNLSVSSTKSMHGHALGASAAFEAVATVMALQYGCLPPTANYSKADPACDLNYIPNAPEMRSVEYALSNSFAFGGLNSVLVFRRWADD